MNAIRVAFDQFIYALLAFPRAWRFIRHYQLWKGLREYKWVFRSLLLVALATGLYLVKDILQWRESHQDATVATFFIGGDSLVANLGKHAYQSFTDGGMKWVILILLEVVIYHFMRKAMHILLGKDMPDANSLNPFLRAQKRMIIVSVVAFGLEFLLTDVGAKVFFGIAFPLRFLKAPTILLIQTALLGSAIVDNYTEQFKFPIDESLKYIFKQHIGTAIGVGLPLFLLLKIPFLGTLIGPILASVTVAIVMRESSNLHILGYQASEKALARAARRASRKQPLVAKEENGALGLDL